MKSSNVFWGSKQTVDIMTLFKNKVLQKCIGLTLEPNESKEARSLSRFEAEKIISEDNPEGYRMLSAWFEKKNQIDKSILFSLIAAREGDSYSKEVIEYYTKRAENDGTLSLILAESCYMAGGLDLEADSFMRQANMLGCGASIPGMIMRNAGNRKRLINERDIKSALDKFSSRLFRDVIVDYGELSKEKQRRCLDLIRGFQISTNALLSIDWEKNEIVLTHWYRERLLVPIGERCERKEFVIRGYDAGETQEAIKCMISSGTTAIVDYSKCVDSAASESFGLLCGCCYGLDGTIRRNGNTVTYAPLYKEDRTESY